MLLFVSISCTQNSVYADDNKNLWHSIEESALPKESQFNSDAFTTKYVKYSDKKNKAFKYFAVEGWEDGWTYSFWNRKKWVTVTNQQEVWSDQFILGHFNSDEFIDLILYKSVEEINFYDEKLPVMPRLFIGKQNSFQSVEISCSKILHNFFLSKLNFYKQFEFPESPTKFLSDIYSSEEALLREECSFSK